MQLDLDPPKALITPLIPAEELMFAHCYMELMKITFGFEGLGSNAVGTAGGKSLATGCIRQCQWRDKH
jgi:hypothetical protein